MINIDVQKERKKYLEAEEHLKKEGLINDELLEKQKENDRRIAEVRGMILSRTTEVENSLNIFLAQYLSNKFGEFYDLVLSKEFFTLNQKIRIFEEIGYYKRKEFGNRYEDLTSLLIKINKARNLVAHGHKMHFTKPEIRLLRKRQQVSLNEKFLKDFLQTFELCIISLSELSHKLIEEKFNI